MAREPADIKKWGGLLFRGFAIKLAPEVAKGILVGIFKAKKVRVKSASDWVESNTFFWKTFDRDE